MKTLPFVLRFAQQPNSVVATKSGELVVEMHLFKNIENYPLKVILYNDLDSLKGYTEDGKHMTFIDSESDLIIVNWEYTIEQLIDMAYRDITRRKGSEHAPDVHEMQKWIAIKVKKFLTED
jgi:hypothetical protein